MHNAKERVTTVIVDLLFKKVVNWPDAAERADISRRFQAKFKLPNLVGVADGTLFPLAFKPSRKDASDFHGRKHLYSLSTLIINDDKKRIRYFNAGWAGCSHDDRILENTELRKKVDIDNVIFSKRQYIIGDCAYAARWWMVSCYKKPPGGTLARDKEIFNTTLSKPRVTSEHTIGILKARFPFLRSIRLRIDEEKESMRQVIRYIATCVILHNIFIGFDDEYDPEDDEVSVIDEENELNKPIVDMETNGDARRRQLMNYIVENYHV